MCLRGAAVGEGSGGCPPHVREKNARRAGAAGMIVVNQRLDSHKPTSTNMATRGGEESEMMGEREGRFGEHYLPSVLVESSALPRLAIMGLSGLEATRAPQPAEGAGGAVGLGLSRFLLMM